MNAIALNSTMFNFARVVGPAIASLVMGYYGVGMCFLANSISFAAVVISLFFIHPLPLSQTVVKPAHSGGDQAGPPVYLQSPHSFRCRIVNGHHRHLRHEPECPDPRLFGDCIASGRNYAGLSLLFLRDRGVDRRHAGSGHEQVWHQQIRDLRRPYNHRAVPDPEQFHQQISAGRTVHCGDRSVLQHVQFHHQLCHVQLDPSNEFRGRVMSVYTLVSSYRSDWEPVCRLGRRLSWRPVRLCSLWCDHGAAADPHVPVQAQEQKPARRRCRHYQKDAPRRSNFNEAALLACLLRRSRCRAQLPSPAPAPG